MNIEDLEKSLSFRHACKVFDETKKISRADMDLILKAAHLSPSSFGFEPWKFLVIQKPELREKLKEKGWGLTKKLETASHFVVCLTKKKHFMHYDSEYITHIMKDIQGLPEANVEIKRNFYKEFQLNDFDLNDERKLFDWASKQCYIPLANMMSTAALLGIDSCPLEGFAQKTSEKILFDELGINEEHYGVSYMLAFGYRVAEPKPKTRQNYNEVVEWIE